MNRNGFTLVELLAVISLIALLTLISFPIINSISKNNKQFEVYEELMVESSKTLAPKIYKDRGYVCLSELNMKKINDSMNCLGYVLIDSNSQEYEPYLKCSQNNQVLYETEDYDSSIECN